MEIVKVRGKRWDLSKLAMPPFKVMWFWTLIDFWRRLWTRFGLTKVRAPQKKFVLISMVWSAEKLIRRSRNQVPKHVSLAACASLPCMFSVTLHLNLRHFDCVSAYFISPLLLFSEASLWQTIVVADEPFHWPPMWTCPVLLASLLTLASYCCCCCFMKLLSDKVLPYQQIPNLENHEVSFSDASAIPTRCPFFLPQTPKCTSVCDTSMFSGGELVRDS